MAPSLSAADLAAALPDVTTPLIAAELDAAVEIVRDGFGVPHIKATTEHDAFFTQGFVTAQDRLFHMDADRMRALGRWAEWAGPAVLPVDRLMRTLGLEAAARADWEVSRPDTRAMVQVHTDGVNFFLATTVALPVEYVVVGAVPAAWEPWQAYAVYKQRNILMGHLDMKLWRAAREKQI